MPAWALAAVIGIGAAHIAARRAGAAALAGVLKPLPILLLAALVAAHGPGAWPYGVLIVLGLLFSAAGDVFLVFPSRFVPGLVSFLVAHVFYVAAFAPAGGWGVGAWLLLVPFALASLALLGGLWPHLGRLGPAVALYVAVITAMAWRAAARAGVVPAPGGGLALAGAVLFMVSDGTLAWDRFVRRLAAADAVVMATYYGAQTLIAASVLV